MAGCGYVAAPHTRRERVPLEPGEMLGERTRREAGKYAPKPLPATGALLPRGSIPFLSITHNELHDELSKEGA